ncbi:hypothetical protein [Sphingomonas alpina]|uniref:Uncharacterized protein n=1 Tax=Sphingomonas alpina TaxID=653931 RepID=A0A7H0LNR7_9SPHN|nr:hypothetical protein [Sphingomonas alpina]QNQ11320.1 hypothetical protein H3Z74_09345 [Sphingomonas alpina]
MADDEIVAADGKTGRLTVPLFLMTGKTIGLIRRFGRLAVPINNSQRAGCYSLFGWLLCWLFHGCYSITARSDINI